MELYTIGLIAVIMGYLIVRDVLVTTKFDEWLNKDDEA